MPSACDTPDIETVVQPDNSPERPPALTSRAARAAPLGNVRALLDSAGGWALADQGVVSLGNCLMGVVLVSTLSADEFGVFTLVFGVVLFLNSLHQSLVTYPLSVRGAAADVESLRRLAGTSLLFTLVMALPLAVGVILILAVLHRTALAPWAIAAMLLWQFQETLRRGIMAHLRHRQALAGDAVRYLGQVLVLLVLARADLLDLRTAFATIAATSLLAAIVQALQLRPSIAAAPRSPAMLGDWWLLGRWVLLTNAVTIVTVQAMPWTLGAFHGSGEVARFGALALVMGLTNPVIMSMGGLLVPAAARAASRGGSRAAGRAALFYALQSATLLLPFYLAVFVAPSFVLGFFTRGNPDYEGLEMHLRLFAMAYLLAFPAQVAGALLNGLGQSRASFLAQCAFSLTTLLVSLPLAARYGLTGAVWAGVLPAAVYVAASFAILRRVRAADAGESCSGASQRPAAPIAASGAGLVAEGVAA